MKSLGVVKNISYDGKLIIKARFTPKKRRWKNMKVMDKNMKTIGIVTKIFGSVNAPYLLVKPTKNIMVEKGKRRTLLSWIGKEVYDGGE